MTTSSPARLAKALPDAAEVLLIIQDSAKVGLTKLMRAPEGWPFNLKWVHLRSTGIDNIPTGSLPCRK